MAPTHTATAASEGEVMAAIDEEADGKRFVVADVSCDNAWITAPLSASLSLEEWC